MAPAGGDACPLLPEPQAQPDSPAHGDLEVLKRLMGFRLVMVTTLLLVAASIEAVSDDLAPVNPMYFVIVATYAFTVLHALALGGLPYRVQVYLQTLSDLSIITALVWITGGVRAGFMLLYPLSVLTGTVLLERGRGLDLAAFATAAYAAVVWGVRVGALPPEGLSDVLFLPETRLAYSVFVTGVACATVALIGSYLTESLRAAGQQLERTAGEVEGLKELNEVIVASIHSGLLTADAGGRISYANRFAETVLGLPYAALRGRALAEVLGDPRFDAAGLRVRAATADLVPMAVAYRRPDGEARELGVSISVLGEDWGYLLAVQDLTEVKRLEREVRIKERLAAVGEMAAALAHEIRNPLGSISGSAQVLMAEPGISEEQQHLLDIIRRESRRLSEALTQFLRQARPTPARLEPLDLVPTIAEAVKLLRNAPEVQPGHEIEFEAGAGPLVCRADRDQILQVFWNLTRNGLEAMPAGGRLRLSLRREGGEVVLSVRDDGHGLAGGAERRIFEPFQTGREMGTGLGLAIVYRIVREHGGDIQVESRPGEGTDVRVRLPLLPLVAVA